MCGFLLDTSGAEREKLLESFRKLQHRGPDHSQSMFIDDFVSFHFHRLAIMDLSLDGSQPFICDDLTMVCNGEIYNHQQLRHEFPSYQFESMSDCEVVLPLFIDQGIKSTLEKLDGEFAFCLYDGSSKQIFAARDPMGIRPLFYGYSKGKILFASEVKALMELCEEVIPFPPGHYYDGSFKSFLNHSRKRDLYIQSESSALAGIRERLESAVIKRLDSDAPVGFLLSGGLDSSLVCAIAAKYEKLKGHDRPIRTFSVGIQEDPIDTHYAREVAEHIGAEHTEFLFSFEEVLDSLRDIVWHLETYDITTIRASVGMYLLCKRIRQTTDIKVLLTGEVSDELFGYKYTDFAPSPEEFQLEAEKRVRELFYYDVLRADRCISAHSIEARVPFSDKAFVEFVMNLDPKMKMNQTGVGKRLLREAFAKTDLLPKSILYREKAAFSDAVGHSMVDRLKEHAEKLFSSSDLSEGQDEFVQYPPQTKEALMYRLLFKELFGKQEHLIPGYWLPNQSWENCQVLDPSARVLPNYGKSGS